MSVIAKEYRLRRERFAEIEAKLTRLVKEAGPVDDPNLLLRGNTKRARVLRRLCEQWLNLHRAHWWP